MDYFQIIYAPNEIFRKKAEAVKEVNDEIRTIIDKMFKTADLEHAIGLGANMVGVLKRIIIVNWHDGGKKIAMINPEITYKSEETETINEGSLSFPGIEAVITRPKKIKVKFLDYDGKEQELEAEDLLAAIIQHETDYLDGKIFLDYLSKMKQNMLLKKMQKHLKKYPPHIHGKGCHH